MFNIVERLFFCIIYVVLVFCYFFEYCKWYIINVLIKKNVIISNLKYFLFYFLIKFC